MPNMKITLKTAEKQCFLLIASADLDRLNPLCFTSPAALKKADPYKISQQNFGDARILRFCY